ncbi:MAG: hypothetical protein RLZZ200_2738 [Pseudomonadota bacterium]|jgi:hypothetical protein
MRESPFRRLLSPFLSRRPPSLEQDDRVLQLFQNRAALKKERSDLQDEILRLKDSLTQQQGATAHVQSQLDRLEALLGNPATGRQALVFFQLKALWRAGSSAVAALVQELSLQQVERERRSFLSEHIGQQLELRRSAESAFQSAQQAAAAARESLQGLQQGRDQASAWWQVFQRRNLDARIEEQERELKACTRALDLAREDLDRIIDEAAPDFPGLSLAARRTINLAAIVYAEILSMPLQRSNLMPLVAQAARRREPATNYGDSAACESYIADIARAQAALPTTAAVAVELRHRAELLQSQASYAFAEDVVPAQDSVSSNALREDYWGLRDLLLS